MLVRSKIENIFSLGIFLLFQHIQQIIRQDFSNVDEILTPPENHDEGVWKYEHLRQFCMELNGLAVKLQVDAT